MYLQHWGVPALTPLSPPASRSIPSSAKPKDRARLPAQARPGWRPARSCCNSPAASASGRSSKFFQAILDVEVPMELVVVAGRNEALKAELEKLPRAGAAPVEGARLHDRNRRTDGRRRPGGLQAGRADDLGNARPRRGDGDRQPDPRPGEPQQRLSCWKTAPPSRSTMSPRWRTS